MFEIDDSKFPRTWSEFSFDYKLFFVNHGAMMLLMIASGVLSTRTMAVIVSVWSAILVQRSIAHRRARQWAWPGINLKDIIGAIASLSLGGFFLIAIALSFVQNSPAMVPIVSAVAGILLLGALQSLHLVAMSEKEFTSCCEGRRPEKSTLVDEPLLWKRATRAVATASFLAVWICGVGSFLIEGIAARNGSPVKSAEKSVAVTDRGTTIYISRDLDRTRTILETTARRGMPAVMVMMLFVQFILGVKMIPHAKSLPELWKEKPWNRKP